MSISYWAIKGYGVKLNNDWFDLKKIFSHYFLQENEELENLENIKFEDFEVFQESEEIYDIEDLIKNVFIEKINSNYFELFSTEMAYSQNVLYYIMPSLLPWERTDLHNKTENIIRKELIDILKPILKDEIDIKDIQKMIGHIDNYGCY